MKRNMIARALWTLAAVIGLLAAGAFAKADTVEVNHKGKVITIARSALQAHLNHGDSEVGDGDDCGDCDPV